MDRSHSTSALDDLPAVSAETGEAPPAPVPDPASTRTALVLSLVGWLDAFAVAWLQCRLPIARTLSWPALVLRAAVYVALTSLAGAQTIRIAWFLRDRRSSKPPRLSRSLVAGVAFIPSILLLDRQDSPWLLLPIAFVAWLAALALRQLFPAADAEPSLLLPTSELPSLYGLPPADSNLVRTFAIALCAQASLLLAAGDHLYLAALLLSLGLFLLSQRIGAINSAHWWIRPAPLRAAAILLTVLALLPWIAHRPSFPGRPFGPPNPPAGGRGSSTDPPSPSSDYVGIVLWPPPVKQTAVVPPAPHSPWFGPGTPSKPLVIPFDGPYWYFKAPSSRPGPRAHVAHGKPTDVNVRSTDGAPLLMEAHQNLGLPIDLACCSEIDVAITNADTRPGAISLAVLLSDSSAPALPPQPLATQIVQSSRFDLIPLNRPPVKEVLRFPIPLHSSLQRFNRITVIFLPNSMRARAGAKVAIDSFALVPGR